MGLRNNVWLNNLLLFSATSIRLRFPRTCSPFLAFLVGERLFFGLALWLALLASALRFMLPGANLSLVSAVARSERRLMPTLLEWDWRVMERTSTVSSFFRPELGQELGCSSNFHRGFCFFVASTYLRFPPHPVVKPCTYFPRDEHETNPVFNKVELLVSEANEKSLSTTLLITPEFSLSNAEAFEVIGQT